MIKCNKCDQEFRRKEFLDRHLTHCHIDLGTFSQIRDCVDSECRDSSSDQISYPEDNRTEDNRTANHISISIQTDICNFPPKRTVTHTGCNATPTLKRARETQLVPTMTSKGV